MILYAIMGVVVLAAFGVVGFLFYFLQKEAKQSEVKIVPIINPQDILAPAGPSPQEEEYKRRVEGLEEELRAISDKGVAQAQEAIAMIETLTKENEKLKSVISDNSRRDEDYAVQFSLIQQEGEQLRKDNVALQSELDASKSSLQQLQDEIVVIRKQTGEELSSVQTTIEQFKVKNAQVEQEAKELQVLKTDNEQFRRQIEDLQLTNEKLKELNGHLIEKGQMLQYELTKHRAQASGLEKICENYKMQLEKRI